MVNNPIRVLIAIDCVAKVFRQTTSKRTLFSISFGNRQRRFLSSEGPPVGQIDVLSSWGLLDEPNSGTYV